MSMGERKNSGANIHWGQSKGDRHQGETGFKNGGGHGTPSLDSIISGKVSPVPNSGSTAGAKQPPITRK